MTGATSGLNSAAWCSKVKAAHTRLCHSRAFHVVAYPRERQEMLFDAHARSIEFWAVPRGAGFTTT